jgi:transcriptional regulator with PAS, ATPase and Fis domain
MAKIMINHFFEDYEDILDQTNIVFFRENMEDYEKNNFLKIWKDNFKGLEKLDILTLDGVIKYSSKAEDVGSDMSNFKFIEKAVTKKIASWSEFQLYPTNRKNQIMVAKKIGQKILVANIDLQCFSKILNEIANNGKNKMFILDNNENAIFYNVGNMNIERKNLKNAFGSPFVNSNRKNPKDTKNSDIDIRLTILI